MTITKNFDNITKYIIFFFPFSIILGNAVLNSYILLVFLFFLFDAYSNKIKIITSFIVFLLSIAIFFGVNIFFSIDINFSIKGSLGILKHLLFFISFLYFFNKNSKNIDYLYIACFFAILFVCFDTLFQYFYGSDIFGFKLQESHGRRLSGPFNDEYVVGSFISKLFFISTLFFKKENLSYKIYLTIYLLLVFIIIFLSKERSAFYLFCFSFLTLFIFLGVKIKFKIIFLSFVIIILFTLFKFDENNTAKDKYIFQTLSWIGLDRFVFVCLESEAFLSHCENKRLVKNKLGHHNFYKTNIEKNNFLHSRHGAHFLTAIEIFKNNIFLGSGIKTFRIECHNKIYEKIKSKSKKTRCNTHPHNLYLEILSEAGIFMFIIFVSFILFILFKILKRLKNENFEMTNLICLMVILFFPLQTSGSFFSTFNGIFYWIGLVVITYKLNINIFSANLSRQS